MATRVFDVLELELQDGSTVEIKPLPIKQLRKFMDFINELGEEPKVDKNGKVIKKPREQIYIFLDCVQVAFTKFKPEIAEDKDKLEDILDVPTMMKIIEVSGSLNLSDDGDAHPNPARLGMN